MTPGSAYVHHVAPSILPSSNSSTQHTVCGGGSVVAGASSCMPPALVPVPVSDSPTGSVVTGPSRLVVGGDVVLAVTPVVLGSGGSWLGPSSEEAVPARDPGSTQAPASGPSAYPP